MVACTMVACKHDNSGSNIETIDINDCFEYEQLDIVRKKYAYDGRVIKLETNDDCLLKYGGRYFFSDNRIFVGQETVYIFDFEGHFINKLKSGNGPGEIAKYEAVDFDVETNELVVFQYPYMKFYTQDGVFLREQKSPYFFSDIKVVEGGYILQSDGGYMQCEKNPEATLLVVDKNMNLISAHIDRIERFMYHDMKACFDTKTKEAIIPNWNDTIYSLCNHLFVPKYKIDYSSNKFDYTKKDYESWSAEEELHYSWWWYFETSTHQLFSFLKGGMRFSVFRDKINGKLLTGKLRNRDELFNIMPDATFNDYFVSVKQYEDIEKFEKLDLFSPEDLAKINNQKEDDNPLLIFFKLKPFDEDEK